MEGARVGLQQVVVGDGAETIIPRYLAYGRGRAGETSLYSALKFCVKLKEIIPGTQRATEVHE